MHEEYLALAELLHLSSRSETDPQLVLDALVRTASRLCGADAAQLLLYDGGAYQPAAAVASAHGSLDRGFRAALGIPLLHDGEVVGILEVAGSLPFGPRQVALLQILAHLAFVASESARLSRQLEQRNQQIAQAVEQQAAASRILRLIRSSPNDVRPVFDAIVTHAARLCEAHFAFVVLNQDGLLHLAAHTPCTPEFVDYLSKGLALGRQTTTGRAALECRPVQIIDFLADPEVVVTQAHRAESVRTVLAVPMMGEDTLLGVITTWRREVRAFSDEQIKLLETFASQAVIAIENARMLSEIEEKSRQLDLANQYKSRFLAAASHDLRQPLHALNLFVAQLHGKTGAKWRKRLIHRIDATVSAMNELFNALLDVSKLDAGVLEPNVAEIPVEQILRRIETTFGEAAREKGLKLRVATSRAWVSSDFILLERILLNLVSNAVRYTSRGGIVVGCRRRGSVLRVEVWDSGPGIPDDRQRDIFGEFYQLARDSHPTGGLGLGLAIVERLCRLLDHPIEVRSSLGRGSRFSVLVPLVSPERSAQAISLSPAVAADPVRGKTIAVIDDDILVLEAMAGVLQSWGCRVVTGTSGEAVLARLSELTARPDVIISDYRLASGITGIEAIQFLRRELDLDAAAFLISGDTTLDSLRDASERGYVLLHKPVAPMALRAILNRSLQAAGLEAARATLSFGAGPDPGRWPQ